MKAVAVLAASLLALAPMGASAGICVGTAEECGLAQPPAEEQEPSAQEREEARQDAQEQASNAFELTVNFELDSAELTAAAKATLVEFAQALKERNIAVGSFAVEGHTDATGAPDYNLGLSERRAIAVVRFLRQQGADVSRFVIRGYGQTKPLADDPYDPLNRRVDTRLILR